MGVVVKGRHPKCVFLAPPGTELGHSAPEIVQSRIPCAYLVLTGVKGL